MKLNFIQARLYLFEAEKSLELQKTFVSYVEKFDHVSQEQRDLILFQLLGQLADSGILEQGEYSQYRVAFERGDRPSPKFLATISTLAGLTQMPIN